jgi:hypothetical protein
MAIFIYGYKQLREKKPAQMHFHSKRSSSSSRYGMNSSTSVETPVHGG